MFWRAVITPRRFFPLSPIPPGVAVFFSPLGGLLDARFLLTPATRPLLEIGEASSKKMEDFSLVLWSQHGVYGAAADIESAFGLIETAEKSAEVLLKMMSVQKPANMIGSKNLRDIAEAFGVEIQENFLR